MQVALGRNVVEHMFRIRICSTQGWINECEAPGKVVTVADRNCLLQIKYYFKKYKKEFRLEATNRG